MGGEGGPPIPPFSVAAAAASQVVGFGPSVHAETGAVMLLATAAFLLSGQVGSGVLWPYSGRRVPAFAGAGLRQGRIAAAAVSWRCVGGVQCIPGQQLAGVYLCGAVPRLASGSALHVLAGLACCWLVQLCCAVLCKSPSAAMPGAAGVLPPGPAAMCLRTAARVPSLHQQYTAAVLLLRALVGPISARWGRSRWCSD